MPGLWGKAKDLFEKQRDKLNDVQDSFSSSRGMPAAQVPMQDSPARIEQPHFKDVLRYRYHHGTNLGSVFVLEKWLTNSMFVEGAGPSELDAVEARVSREGIDATRERHEQHWRDYVSDTDLNWLRDTARCTTVRLPIGYFTLGPAYCQGTPFERVSGVYQNAWQAVTELVGRCYARGIGVLIDMHCLPGGANAQNHSGTNSKKAEFWGSAQNRAMGLRALCFVAEKCKNMDGVVGIEVVNEAEHNAQGMWDFYNNAIKEMSSIDPSMPVYVSDAWNLTEAVKWSSRVNTVANAQSCPAVLDSHLYWCFTEMDKDKSPQIIAEEAKTKLGGLEGHDGNVCAYGANQAVVGEYSCVLGDDCWKRGMMDKEDLVHIFGQAQSQRFHERAGGSFFWTYRMDWMPGGEWGFKKMTEAGAISPPPNLLLSAEEVSNRLKFAQDQQEERQRYALQNSRAQDVERFRAGWDVGYQDAVNFFQTRNQQGLEGGDRIGMLDLWVLKRLRESGQGGNHIADFEHGLRQGIGDFYASAGI